MWIISVDIYHIRESKIVEAQRKGACLNSQHLEGGGFDQGRVQDHSQLHKEFVGSLGYMKQKEKRGNWK